MAGTWVVTGGAGDIGGHVVAALRCEVVPVVVLDDLSTGRADRLPVDVPLVTGRVGDPRVLRSVLTGAAGVVHLAAPRHPRWPTRARPPCCPACCVPSPGPR